MNYTIVFGVFGARLISRQMFPPTTLHLRRAALAVALLVPVLPIETRAADVIISEVLASNTSGITDEDGDDSDWIELSNTSGAAVDLGGWHLTDDATQLEKWTFPNITLNPGGELLVFASDKDRAAAGAELHTNFKLASGGEDLALVRPDGVSIEYKFDPYPQQYPDVSYGSGTPGGETVKLVGPEDVLSGSRCRATPPRIPAGQTRGMPCPSMTAAGRTAGWG